MRQDDVPCCIPEFWAYLLISFILVSFAGITSGLALGLLSFNHVDLEVLIKSGQPQERKNAAKILPVVKNEHLLLCTLLIVKSLAMEALPIFLDSILPSWAAILLSVTLVLAFAEIVPQAVCARYGLTLGAKLSAFVRFLLMVFYPIARPISKLLDWMLGKDHSALLRRAELKTLVDLHAIEAGKGGDLSHHETTIISGALDLTLKTAKDAMTPLSETFSLDINSKLDLHTMGLIMSKGHSRVPIYSGKLNNIIGVILVKNLIFCRPEDETPIKYLTIRSVPRVHEDWPLYDILNQFQKGHSHMAIVVKSKKKANGTVGDVGRPTMLHILEQKQVDRKGLSPPFDQTEGRSISTNTSPLYSIDTEFQSPTSKPVIERVTSLNPQTEKSEQGNVRFSPEGVDLLPCKSDEEVVGIITMEDVMEELLQGEILDETDEYVNFYNKLRINLLPSRRSSFKSPSRFSVTSHFWRTPEASPLSTYSPVLRSPISPYILPPLIRPTLSASPERAMMKSHPTGFASYCAALHPLIKVSRKSYEI